MDEFRDENPTDVTHVREQLLAFSAPLRGCGSRIAVVTSGGTTVPLERNCVRFVDNFSSGRRGAISTEELLKVCTSRSPGSTQLHQPETLKCSLACCSPPQGYSTCACVGALPGLSVVACQCVVILCDRAL